MLCKPCKKKRAKREDAPPTQRDGIIESLICGGNPSPSEREIDEALRVFRNQRRHAAYHFEKAAGALLQKGIEDPSEEQIAEEVELSRAKKSAAAPKTSLRQEAEALVRHSNSIKVSRGEKPVALSNKKISATIAELRNKKRGLPYASAVEIMDERERQKSTAARLMEQDLRPFRTEGERTHSPEDTKALITYLLEQQAYFPHLRRVDDEC